jgi:hypothetical protein
MTATATKTFRHVIHSIEEDSYWSNESGWGCLGAADVFDILDVGSLRLPLGGRWVALKLYSVLLRYPDYLDETGYETYYAFVDAPDAIEAVAMAQRQAVEAQAVDIDDLTDFAPLLVTQGHHYSEALFNK